MYYSGSDGLEYFKARYVEFVAFACSKYIQLTSVIKCIIYRVFLTRTLNILIFQKKNLFFRLRYLTCVQLRSTVMSSINKLRAAFFKQPLLILIKQNDIYKFYLCI